MIKISDGAAGAVLWRPFELKEVQPGGGFDGYASVFGRIDQGRDVVMPGAFAASLRQRGAAGVKMLWQHDPAQPIGVYDVIREDAHGLYVRGRLLLDVQKAREAHALMQAGAIDGLSIGYRAVKAMRDEAGLRRLEEIDLWEISLVTFPMQDEARVCAGKGRPETLRQFEAFLRDAGGFTRNEAKTIAAKGFSTDRRNADSMSSRRDADWVAVMHSLHGAIARLRAI